MRNLAEESLQRAWEARRTGAIDERQLKQLQARADIAWGEADALISRAATGILGQAQVTIWREERWRGSGGRLHPPALTPPWAACPCAALQVVVCTCNGAGDSRLQEQSFRVVVLDEASQATEASTLVPLVKGAECVVAAGDPNQLPPTVLSQEALR